MQKSTFAFHSLYVASKKRMLEQACTVGGRCAKDGKFERGDARINTIELLISLFESIAHFQLQIKKFLVHSIKPFRHIGETIGNDSRKSCNSGNRNFSPFRF